MVRRWPYVAAVLLVTGLVVLAVARPRAEDSPTPTGPSLPPLPGTVLGDWVRVDDAATEQEEGEFRRALDELNGDVRSVVEQFVREGTGRLRITALVPMAGGRTSLALRQDPAARLAEFLEPVATQDRRSVDPGDLGGTMECWESAGADFPILCAWADDWALALIRYDQVGLDLDGAIDLTLALRTEFAGAT